MCLLREQAHLKKGYTPKGKSDTISTGTYYLTEIDDKFKRMYEIKV